MSPRVIRRLTDLLVFVGPSGGGKSTLIKLLHRDYPNAFGFSISHTTRSPRPGETDGVEYHFVATEAFERLIQSNAMVEYTKLNSGNSGSAAGSARPFNYYGTSKKALFDVLGENKVVLMDTDLQGARNLRRMCHGTNGQPIVEKPVSTSSPHYDVDTLRCMIVLVTPPDVATVEKRLRARNTETEESFAKRMVINAQWMAWCDANASFFDHRVINDDLDTCYAEMRKTVLPTVLDLR